MELKGRLKFQYPASFIQSDSKKKKECNSKNEINKNFTWEKNVEIWGRQLESPAQQMFKIFRLYIYFWGGTMKSAGDVFIILINLFFWRIVYSFSDNITMINISLCTKNKVRLLL